MARGHADSHIQSGEFFSRIAAASVFLVVITDTFRGLDAVGGWEGLTQTAYGRVDFSVLGDSGS